MNCEQLYKRVSQTVPKEPFLLVVNAENFNQEDANSLASQLLSVFDDFPLTEIPDQQVAGRLENDYVDFFTSQRITADSVPSVRVIAKSSELKTFESYPGKLSINHLKEFLDCNRAPLINKSQLVLAVAYCISEAAKLVAQLERDHKERKREREEKERKERERKERERRERERREDEMPDVKLPPSLQPTLRPLDENNAKSWFAEAKTLYTKYGVEEANIACHLGSFLPAYVQNAHAENVGQPWELYTQAMITRIQGNKTNGSLRAKLLKMRKSDEESTRKFILRVLDMAAYAEPKMNDEELSNILLEILPESEAELLVNMTTSDPLELLKNLDVALEKREILQKRKHAAETSHKALEEKLDKFQKFVEDKLLSPQAEKPHKIAALLDSLSVKETEEPKPTSTSTDEKLDQVLAFMKEKQNWGQKQGGQGNNQGNSNRGNRRGRGNRGYNNGNGGQFYGQSQNGAQYFGNYGAFPQQQNSQQKPQYNYQQFPSGNQWYSGGATGGSQAYGGHYGYSPNQNFNFNPNQNRRRNCYLCKSPDHLMANCPRISAFLGK